MKKVRTARKMWLTCFILTSCFALLCGGTVLANTDAADHEEEVFEATILMVEDSGPALAPEELERLEGNSNDSDGNDYQIVIYDYAYESDELIEKHREIDEYVFKENNGSFPDFKVTHIGPMNGNVEIGITPYEEEYADYLYELFGDELVKVAEGFEATTLQGSDDADDLPLSVEADLSVTTTVATDNNADEEEYAVQITSTDVAGGSSSTSTLLIVGAIALVALLGLGGLFFFRRSQTA